MLNHVIIVITDIITTTTTMGGSKVEMKGEIVAVAKLTAVMTVAANVTAEMAVANETFDSLGHGKLAFTQKRNSNTHTSVKVANIKQIYSLRFTQFPDT